MNPTVFISNLMPSARETADQRDDLFAAILPARDRRMQG
jgi:hypothetical protein